MKGKTIFSQSEINQLITLINERVKADRSKQKGIRAKMRRIGFYGSDFGINDLQVTDFKRLLNSGKIQIKGQKSVNNSSSVEPKVVNEASPSKSVSTFNGFRLFDPQKHQAHHIPDKPGNYLICLKKSAMLPDIRISVVMQNFEGLKVIYTGIAGKSLRKRDYKDHFTGNNAGKSTLRKSLGSLMGYKKIPRDKDPNTGKTKFTERDEMQLSGWMRKNLLLYFKVDDNPGLLENDLIREFNPPLNLSKNYQDANHEYRKELSRLRKVKS